MTPLDSWVTAKPSKRNKDYEEYLKKGAPESEKFHKNYKSLFESFKKKSKKLYCSKKLLKLQGNAKQAWKVKEIIVKAKLLHFSHLTKKITLNKID